MSIPRGLEKSGDCHAEANIALCNPEKLLNEVHD